MAKGDRENLKADIEDGFTKIANLLLEALSMAKLNGVQKGICLFIWRRTYGWKRKEDVITLREFAQACNTSPSYISRQLKQLIEWGIITRTSYSPGKTPAYTFNTRLSEWDKGCIDVQGLYEYEIQGLYECSRVVLHECARVNQAQTQQGQGFEAPLKKEERNITNNTNTNTPAIDFENVNSLGIISNFENEFGRPLSPIEIQQIMAWAGEGVSEPLLLEALKRASLSGKLNIAYIRAIITDWLKNNVRSLRDVEERDKRFKQRIGERGKIRNREPPPKTKGDDPFGFLDISKFEYNGA